jgi:hypothetical protein
MESTGNRTRTLEQVMHIVFLATATASIISVILISAFIFMTGIPTMAEIGLGEFLLGRNWFPRHTPAQFGIFPGGFTIRKGNFRNIGRLIPDALQIRDHFQRGGNQTQVGSDRLLPQKQRNAVALDGFFHLVDFMVSLDDLFSKIGIAVFQAG